MDVSSITLLLRLRLFSLLSACPAAIKNITMVSGIEEDDGMGTTTLIPKYAMSCSEKGTHANF